MSLKSVTVPTKTVHIPGSDSSFEVRGLSFSDITILYSAFEGPMTALFDKFAGLEDVGKLSVSDPNMNMIGETIIKDAPHLAAAAIAQAADEPDEVEKVLKLPFPVQLEALKIIGALTFATEGGLKKVIETVTSLAIGTRDLLPSEAGSGASAAK